MFRVRHSLLLSVALLLSSSAPASAQERELLYSKSPSVKLQEITAIIRNPRSPVTPNNQLTRQSEYFVRIGPRKYIFAADGTLQERARLGGKPFVFVTTPESVYGLSLLDTYVGIGYEAEDIIRWQRDEDMVMIVFRYPAEIGSTDIANGQLPSDWSRKVIVPTWENMFSLFNLLISPGPGTSPEKSIALTQQEKDFVLGFPAAGKQKIATTAYAALKGMGGPEWKYRSLLEQKLSVFEHFRGNGQTQNEVLDPEGVQAGLLEFVGPNWNLKELPEVAIIHLGKLGMIDTYGGGCALCGATAGPQGNTSPQPIPTIEPSGGSAMSLTSFMNILEILIWPLVALVAIFVIRPHLSALMSKAKVKLSIFGQTIETTLPELEKIIEEQAEGTLTEKQINYLESLSHGDKQYPNQMESEHRKLLRPIRNSGLIMTIPKDAFLSEAEGIRLSALGRLYLRARSATKPADAR